ncbi:MAG: hypothetical protein JJT96_14435 [Opitutales bacterium]|nr:hypothetical protein [Opitutales bacterium]
MNPLSYSSSLHLQDRRHLERIFFFNQSQPRYHERIVAAIELYSKPVVVVEGEKVFLAFEDRAVGQSLHVFEETAKGRLFLGALLYTRDRPERVTIAHIALRERCRHNFQILTQIAEDLRKNFRRIQGVRELHFFYAGRTLRV